MEIAPDEDDEFTDIREQIFHNTVREQIVSNRNETTHTKKNPFAKKYCNWNFNWFQFHSEKQTC